MRTLDERLQRDVDRAAGDVAGVVVRMEHPESGWSWHGERGDLTQRTPFFIASVTKLATTAIVLRLVERNALRLEDRLVDIVDPVLVHRLHVRRGVDHTPRITVRHLLSQTSGLPDYLGGRRRGHPSLQSELLAGNDRAWTLPDVLGTARALGGRFEPGKGRRALYSDTNFQLLGHIIERCVGASYADAVRTEIVQPLALDAMWVHEDLADMRPAALRHRGSPLQIPRAMASVGADGGVVADATNLMRFL
jgi:D-alanyl-D-alanine carboxypeptidase